MRDKTKTLAYTEDEDVTCQWSKRPISRGRQGQLSHHHRWTRPLQREVEEMGRQAQRAFRELERDAT